MILYTICAIDTAVHKAQRVREYVQRVAAEPSMLARNLYSLKLCEARIVA